MSKLALLLFMAPSVAFACATVSVMGLVPIVGEEALIVWDEAHHTEHFIRRAAFADAPADFGFLVPTPSRPDLQEVDDAVFTRCGSATNAS